MFIVEEDGDRLTVFLSRAVFRGLNGSIGLDFKNGFLRIGLRLVGLSRKKFFLNRRS